MFLRQMQSQAASPSMAMIPSIMGRSRSVSSKFGPMQSKKFHHHSLPLGRGIARNDTGKISMNRRSYTSLNLQQSHERKPSSIAQSKLAPIRTIIAGQSSNHNFISKRWHGGPSVDREAAQSIHVNFVDCDGSPIKENVDAYVGESLLQVAQRNDIELEGACEGVCACSTCHVIFPDWKTFDLLEEASEDEEDMLDMAFGLTETSRLSCQIVIADHMDGMQVEIPKATRNFYVDGHVPQPH